jgi:hypothetical protein
MPTPGTVDHLQEETGQMGNHTNKTSDPTPAPSGSAPTATLSHGADIKYKAFVRSFSKGDSAGVLFLLASCYYATSGFTIFFQENGGKYQLMEQPPTGVFLNLVTYYAACWPAQGVSFEADNLPHQVTIVDAEGEHVVEVHHWR